MIVWAHPSGTYEQPLMLADAQQVSNLLIVHGHTAAAGLSMSRNRLA